MQHHSKDWAALTVPTIICCIMIAFAFAAWKGKIRANSRRSDDYPITTFSMRRILEAMPSTLVGAVAFYVGIFFNLVGPKLSNNVLRVIFKLLQFPFLISGVILVALGTLVLFAERPQRLIPPYLRTTKTGDTGKS